MNREELRKREKERAEISRKMKEEDENRLKKEKEQMSVEKRNEREMQRKEMRDDIKNKMKLSPSTDPTVIEWKGTDALNKAKTDENNSTVELKVVNQNEVKPKGGIINCINRKLENKDKLQIDTKDKENDN